MELERQEDILIVSHQAVLRCIYGYFMNIDRDKLPYINIPLHTVIQLTPKAYGCEEVRFKVDIEAVDTFRPQPIKTKKMSIRVETPSTPTILKKSDLQANKSTE
jgi:6-phosphofructo-2-kinase/fructose-2,6-biphosphatase 2